MIRILSRDKTHLEVLTTERMMNSLVHHTGLDMYAQQHSDSVTIQEGDYSGLNFSSEQGETEQLNPCLVLSYLRIICFIYFKLELLT